jgi:hypothetical protein
MRMIKKTKSTMKPGRDLLSSRIVVTSVFIAAVAYQEFSRQEQAVAGA